MASCKHFVCCEDFKRAVDTDTIEYAGSPEGMEYYIEQQDLVDNGDGRFDNMGELFYLKYCPFCGNEIKTEAPKEE